MVVGQQPVGRVMRVDIDHLVVCIKQTGFLGQLQTTHPVVILKNVIELSIRIDKDVDSLIAHKIHLLPTLLLHFLPTHRHDFGIFFLSCFHPAMEVPTHAHTLHLHIDFAQQIISSHLFIRIGDYPGLAQKFIGEIFGLVEAIFHEKYFCYEFIQLKLQIPLELIIYLDLSIIECFQCPIEVVECKTVTTILKQHKA